MLRKFSNTRSVFFGRAGLIFFMAFLCSSYSGKQTVLIHSHNDYQKNIPFYRAYSQQVHTIEADIYAAPASDGFTNSIRRFRSMKCISNR